VFFHTSYNRKKQSSNLITCNLQKGDQMTKERALSLVLFLILGTIAYFARYGEVINSTHVNTLKDWAPWIVLFIGGITILLAHEDSVYQMLLCILVPGYFLYYILFVSQRLYLRAIIAAVLVATAQDAFMQYSDWLNAFVEGGHEWIESGGE
jgi:hypothetical protein